MAVCFSSVFIGCRAKQPRKGPADLASARERLVAVFQQADTLELYTIYWPGEEDVEHSLGTITRQEDPGRWEAFLDNLRRAGPKSHHQGIPLVLIRVRAGGQILATGCAYPPTGELSLRLPERNPVSVTVRDPLNGLLYSYHKRVELALRQSRPAASSEQARPEPEPPAPLPTVEEVRQRMVAILEECIWANFGRAGRDVVEILPRANHKQAWNLLLQGVREAKPGLAVPGWPPDHFLLCEVPTGGGQSEMHMLLFKDGMLASEEPYLGRMARTIKPGPQFLQGLEALRQSTGLDCTPGPGQNGVKCSTL